MPPVQEEPEDDVEEDESLEWMLGFVDEPEKPTDLLRHRFPSKIGGRPAWLHPVALPTKAQLTCGVTGKQLNFLLQVYAPVDGPDDCFHRALFLFVSPQGDKLAQPGTVRALRCQLPRLNDYYSFHPAKESDLAPQRLTASQADAVKGRDPWRVAEAEQALAAGQPPSHLPPVASSVDLLPELELAVEPEEGGDSDEEGAAARGGPAQKEEAERALAEYQARVAAEGEVSDDELPPEVVDMVDKHLGEDKKAFAMFQARVGANPDQVIRYCFQDGAQPLWPRPDHRPSQIPPCPRCGKPRKFEFQVLPQLLHYLDLDNEDDDALDWGTIAVYTCSDSCAVPSAPPDGGSSTEWSAYVDEFVWVQPS